MHTTQLNVTVPRIPDHHASRRWALGVLLVATFVVADGGLGGWSRAEASHNTCGLIAQVPGGQTAVEAWALASLNSKLPKSFSGKVTVGHVPVTHDPIKVNVDATILKPAKNVDIVCTPSSFSCKFDIRVRVSGRLGSDTHSGDGRITGHYTVTTSPTRVCVSNLSMAGLNLQGVQNDVDNWIRKQINASSLIGPFSVP